MNNIQKKKKKIKQICSKEYMNEDKIIIESLDEEDMKIIERGRREIEKGEYEDMDKVS